MNSVAMVNQQIDHEEQYFVSYEIFIKDSGLGIKEEDLSKLFLNFSKLADKAGNNQSGTGLGLSICKNIIEKMGGSVRAESEGIGMGTTFVITMNNVCKLASIGIKQLQINLLDIEQKEKNNIEIIKQERALFLAQNNSQDKFAINFKNDQVLQDKNNNNSKVDTVKEEQVAGGVINKLSQNKNNQLQINEIKVLLINDEFFILKMWTLMVQVTGITKIQTAQNGYDGYQLIQKEQFDFVICDLNMTVMDGFQFAQKVRADLVEKNLLFSNIQEQKFCPFLVACSSLVTTEIEIRAIESGFDIALQAPLTIDIIQNSVFSCLKEREDKRNQDQREKNMMSNSILVEKLELGQLQKIKSQIEIITSQHDSLEYDQEEGESSVSENLLITDLEDNAFLIDEKSQKYSEEINFIKEESEESDA